MHQTLLVVRRCRRQLAPFASQIAERQERFRHPAPIAQFTCHCQTLATECFHPLVLGVVKGDTPERLQGVGDSRPVVQGATERQTLVAQCRRPRVVALVVGQRARSVQRAGAQDRPPAASICQRSLKPGSPLGKVTPDIPEPPERPRQPQGHSRSPVQCPTKGGPHVVAFVSSRANQCTCSEPRRLGSADSASASTYPACRRCTPQSRRPPSCSCAYSRIVSSIPNRGSPSAASSRRSRLWSTSAAMPSKTRGTGGQGDRGTEREKDGVVLSVYPSVRLSVSPILSPCPPVPLSPCDGLRRLQREAAGEDGEAAEEGLLVGGQEVVAPGDRVAHGALARGAVARPAGQQRQAVVQAGQEGRRRQRRMRAAASSIASGRPSSRRQIAATAAALLVGQGEVGLRPPAPAGRRGATAADRCQLGERQAASPVAGSASGGTGNVVLAARGGAPPGW